MMSNCPSAPRRLSCWLSIAFSPPPHPPTTPSQHVEAQVLGGLPGGLSGLAPLRQADDGASLASRSHIRNGSMLSSVGGGVVSRAGAAAVRADSAVRRAAGAVGQLHGRLRADGKHPGCAPPSPTARVLSSPSAALASPSSNRRLPTLCAQKKALRCAARVEVMNKEVRMRRILRRMFVFARRVRTGAMGAHGLPVCWRPSLFGWKCPSMRNGRAAE